MTQAPIDVFLDGKQTSPGSGPVRPLILSGALMILVIAVAGYLLARDIHHVTIQTVNRGLASLAVVLADQADRALQGIELVQDAVSEDVLDGTVFNEADFARRASQFSIHDRLKARIAAMPQVNAVTIVDNEGKLLNFSRSWPIPEVNVADRDYFQALSRDPHLTRFVSKPVQNRGDGTWTIYMARKLTAPDGQFLGLVLGAVELSYFEKLYAEIASEPDAVFSMFRTDGVLIARHPNRADAIGQTFSQTAVARIMASDQSGTGQIRMRSPVDGLDRFFATRALAHYPLILTASRTAASALAQCREEALALEGAVILLVLGLCVTLTLGARQIRGQGKLARSEAARVAAEERERGERLLREEYARFGTAIDSMTQGLALFDEHDRLILLNARFIAMYAVPQALQRPGTPHRVLFDYLSGFAGDGFNGRAGEDLWSGSDVRSSAEFTRGLDDGRVIAVCHALVPAGGFVCTHEDVTERRRNEATITHMAHHDALTGLPNRLLIQEHLERVIASDAWRRDGAVLLLDLDGFKKVNDVHGHLCGDELLRLVARRLRDTVGEGDLLARLGGDEFVVVRHGSGLPADAQALAERIAAALRAPFVVQGAEITIATSIGLAMADIADATPELLIRHADIALFRAKADGRAAWCLYEPQMEIEVRGRQSLEADLRRAVAEQQFVLHYQPIYATHGGLIGCEALVRWNHATRGMVSPGEFIPLCEATGLIRELGAWVLQKACADAVTWPESVKVAVNLSPVQFRATDLVDQVRQALAATGLSPRRMELEITESVMLQDDMTNLTILQELHALGVQIAMDDFGTGYSSLSYLRRFPFDKIKIDQSFVRDLSSDRDNLAIVRAAIGLGRALGMTVLAEGVETAEQAAILTAEGCHELQGFHLGRPKPLADILALFGEKAQAAA